MQITVNGEPREVREGTSLDELLDELKPPAKFFAVEVNLQVIPRREYAKYRLSEGDRLEVVSFVGGG